MLRYQRAAGRERHVAERGSYLYPGRNNANEPFPAGEPTNVVTVPPGQLWVEGDHRDDSADSRAHTGDPGGGTIPEDKVVGRAFAIVWPPSRTGLLSVPEHVPLGLQPEAIGLPYAIGAVSVLPVGLLSRRRRRRRARSLAASTDRRLSRRRVVTRWQASTPIERNLAKVGLDPVAGADEAGRGACAGPLVVGAAVLGPGRAGQVPGLNDSKLLTAAARERVYAQVVKRAVAWSVVVISAAEVDRIGLHVANLQGMRRAIAQLSIRPAYVLTDGFPVAGIGAPGLAVWKGDQVAACIAAASVLAKVTRDRIMVELHDEFPAYGFAGHKGYITREHQAALADHGPCARASALVRQRAHARHRDSGSVRRGCRRGPDQ